MRFPVLFKLQKLAKKSLTEHFACVNVIFDTLSECRNQEVHIMRVGIILACTECKNRNYTTDKNKKNNPDRLEINKYCPHCKKHTLHKETK